MTEAADRVTEGNDRIDELQGRLFPPYSNYRDSGVEWLGAIPEDWEVRRLRYVVGMNISKNEVRHLDPDTEVSFVPMEAIHEYGGIDLDSTKPLSEVVGGYTYFRDGDVIVAKITPCFENGKGALATELCGAVGFGTTELHVLRPSFQIAPRFLLYLTFSDHFRRIGAASMYGAGGQKRISDEFIRNFRHPLPSLSEQYAIARFLDRVTARIDALVARKERLIELLQEKRTALITRAVTRGLDPSVPMKDSGVDWLGEIPAHWDVAPVYARYNVALGKMLDAKRVTGESLGKYLRNADVQWDAVQFEDLPEMDFSQSERKRYLLRSGDLLVCEGGEVGRTAIWRGELKECFYQKAIHRVRPRSDSEVPRFFYYLMYAMAKQGVFTAGGNPNTIDHLTAVQLRHYRVPFPSAWEQSEIITFLDHETARANGLIAKVRQAIDYFNEFRTALISAAVTGKIDVRVAVPR